MMKNDVKDNLRKQMDDLEQLLTEMGLPLVGMAMQLRRQLDSVEHMFHQLKDYVEETPEYRARVREHEQYGVTEEQMNTCRELLSCPFDCVRWMRTAEFFRRQTMDDRVKLFMMMHEVAKEREKRHYLAYHSYTPQDDDMLRLVRWDDMVSERRDLFDTVNSGFHGCDEEGARAAMRFFEEKRDYPEEQAMILYWLWEIIHEQRLFFEQPGMFPCGTMFGDLTMERRGFLRRIKRMLKME